MGMASGAVDKYLDLSLEERVKVHQCGGGTAMKPCWGATGTFRPQWAWRSPLGVLRGGWTSFWEPESLLRTAETLRSGRKGVATCHCVL